MIASRGGPRSAEERRARSDPHSGGLRASVAAAARGFTGAVYIDTVARPSGASRLSASSVHFTPGARTAWHTHPNGQTIYVTEGVGLAQRRGGPIEVIRPGDRVFFEPGEEHWHGAAPTRFMTHLAMLDVDDEGNNATWATTSATRSTGRRRQSTTSPASRFFRARRAR
jgi:quercetin dioxygenase-like cupin family protein